MSGHDEFATASEAAVAIGIAGALGAAVTGVTDCRMQTRQLAAWA